LIFSFFESSTEFLLLEIEKIVLSRGRFWGNCFVAKTLERSFGSVIRDRSIAFAGDRFSWRFGRNLNWR
jgi:hypothetical protein